MHQKIQAEIKTAMRAKDQLKLDTLRGIIAAFTNESVAKGRKPQEALTEEESANVIKRLVKQRKDSIEQFEKAGRDDLAHNEKAELRILEEFMPPQMSEGELRAIIKKKIEESEIKDKSKIGQLIGVIIKETRGQADGSMIKKIVEELL